MAEWKVSRSRNYTLHTLEAAMKAANLLRAPKPPTAVSNVNNDDTVANYDEDMGITRRRSMSSSNDSNIGASPEEQLRRAAREKLQEQAYYYTDVQAQFDDQKRDYLNNLEQYKQRAKEGEDIFSWSEFDRWALTYGMELTGALIDAEAAFDEALEDARALGATHSTYEQESAEERAFNYGSDCMTGWSPTAEHLEARNDAGDCDSVQAWRAKVGDARVCEGSREETQEQLRYRRV